MKNGKHLYLNIILLLIVFFIRGTDVYCNLLKQSHSIEQSSFPIGPEIVISQDNESMDEDQTDQCYRSLFIKMSVTQMAIFQGIPTLDNFCFSVWQPPKTI